MVMGEFLPYAGANSVQEAIIGVHFQNEWGLGPIPKFIESLKPHLPEFTRAQPIQVAEISIDASNQNAMPSQGRAQYQQVGFEFSRVASDGSQEQAIRYMPGLLTAHFSKYRSWESALSASLRHMTSLILPALDLKMNPINAISLRYIDKYTYTGDSAEAHAGLLFNPDNRHISEQCFSAGSSWHCHTGWFEEEQGYSKTLNQLNVSSQIINESAVVTIDHNEVCRLHTPRKTAQELVEKRPGLQPVLEELHTKNKLLLQDILLDDMLQRIGLSHE